METGQGAVQQDSLCTYSSHGDGEYIRVVQSLQQEGTLPCVGAGRETLFFYHRQVEFLRMWKYTTHVLK